MTMVSGRPKVSPLIVLLLAFILLVFCFLGVSVYLRRKPKAPAIPAVPGLICET